MSLRFNYCLIFILPISFLFLTSDTAVAGLVINEFLPDPHGADAGQEFVELLNTGPGSINLEGVEFQFANGSVGPEWTTRWVCSTQRWLDQGERFLLVDRNWMGNQSGDAEVWLGLQNGPDAIRLLTGSEVLDLVGYGPLTDAGMMEGGAADVSVGLSLMRKPDGQDTDENHLDFTSGEPTPGEVNFRNHEIEVISVAMDPTSLAEPGVSVLLEVTLRNTGLLNLPPGQAHLVLRLGNGETTPLLDTFFAGCSSGETCQLLMEMLPLAAGRFSVLLQLGVADTELSLEVDLGKFQVGSAGVFLSEILSTPSSHQGEWIEIQAGGETINTGNLCIRDEEGDWRYLPDVELQPGQFLMVAQDSAALEDWHLNNLSQGLVLDCPLIQIQQSLRQLSGAWPSLNNSPPESRAYADRVYLADEEGIVDQVTLPAEHEGTDFRGKSWERMSHDPLSFRWKSWRPCVAAAGGTPGCRNSVAQDGVAAGVLEIVPPLLDAAMGESIVHVRFLLEPGEVGWHVEVYDLWGAIVRDLGGGDTGAGPGDLIWDGRDDHGQMVENGGYVVLLLKSRADGVFAPSAKHLVVVR